MSAFAAILALNGDRPVTGEDSAAVSAVLESITGAQARSWQSGPCELLMAPLHAWEPREPVRLENTTLAAVGQVMLEARNDVAHRLHQPFTASDLHVAAAAYDRSGVDFARHLRGEYACAIWDGHEQRLTCARDPLGIRPLYVGSSTEVIVVSNVIEALTAHPAVSEEFDDAALARFLATGEVTSGVATAYRAIRLIPEGHTLTITSRGAAALTRHWQPPPSQRARQQRREYFVSAYRDVLRTAVRDRTGGRPCTIFLSGGIDSTTLAAVGIECASPLRAVTFAHKGIGLDEEVSLAEGVAERLSLPIDVINGHADVALEAERTGRGPAIPVDEPSLSNWRVGLHAAASFSTLAIVGEDGDALFAPPGGSALLAAQSLRGLVRSTIASVVTGGRVPYLGLRLRERLGWTRSAQPTDATWLTPDARRLAESEDDWTVLGQRVQSLDLDPQAARAWERLLRNVPRRFAISISPDVTRERLALTLPLMDTRVIDFVMSVPPIPWCQDKYLARTAFAGRLPSNVLTRRKTPATGLDAARVEGWRRHLTKHSIALTAAAGRWIDEGRWRDALERGTPQVTMAAWRVLMLDAWLTRSSRNVLTCTG